MDGGVISQVFLYPRRSLMELQKATGKPFRRELYVFVIRNDRLEPEWSETKRRTIRIGGRAISVLTQTQGTSDLGRLYLTAKQDRADFNLAYIGSNFDYPHEKEFDTEYMKQLFAHSYKLGAEGYPWLKAMPVEALPPHD